MEPTELLQLRRHRDGAALAGVCAALAERWQVDVLLVRVAAVLLGLSAGLGVALYACAWVALPTTHGPALLRRWLPGSADWSSQRLVNVVAGSAAVLALLLLLIFAAALPWSIGPGAVVLALVVFGRMGRPDPGPGEPAPSAWPTDEFAVALAAWHERLAAVGRAGVAPTELTTRPPAPMTTANSTAVAADPATAWHPTGATAAPPSTLVGQWQQRRAERRARGLAGLAVLALAAASGLATRQWAHVTDPVLLGQSVALGVLALGLLAGVVLRRPRPRFVVLAGVVLLAVMCSAPYENDAVNGRTSSVVWSSAAQLPDRPVRVNASRASYDLSDMHLASDRQFALDANASNVVVTVPRSVALVVDYHLVGGNLAVTRGRTELFQHAGVMRSSWSDPAPDGDSPTLTLTLTARASTVEVHRG